MQESICQNAEGKQVLRRANDCCVLCRSGRACCEVGPLGGYMRFTAIWQNDDEEQPVLLLEMTKDFEALSFKGMMTADDGDPIRIVPEVGSLRWFPSTG